MFRAWIDPDQLARWYGPAGVSTPRETIEFDVRPGGRWSLTMLNDETGDEYPAGGVFQEIVEPRRLVTGLTDEHRRAGVHDGALDKLAEMTGAHA